MELKKLEYDFTVCKVEAITDIDMTTDFFFVGKTDEGLLLDSSRSFFVPVIPSHRGMAGFFVFVEFLRGLKKDFSKNFCDDPPFCKKSPQLVIGKQNFHEP